MSHDQLPIPGQRPSFFARSPSRVIVLWLLVFLVAVTIFQLVFVTPERGAQWTPPPRPAPAWGELLTQSLPMLATVCAFLFMLFWLRRNRRFPQQLGEGVAAYQQGDLERADQLFAAMAKAYRFPALLPAQVRYHQGLVALRKGDLAEATKLFGDLAKGSSLLRVREFAEWVPAHLSISLALRGELDLAERWLDEARAKRVPNSRMVLVAEAVLLSRRGRHAEVARLLEDGWREAEAALAGDWLRVLRLLRAFAASRTGGPRGEGEVHELLLGLRPCRPGEFDPLAGAWPELAAFLSLARLS